MTHATRVGLVAAFAMLGSSACSRAPAPGAGAPRASSEAAVATVAVASSRGEQAPAAPSTSTAGTAATRLDTANLPLVLDGFVHDPDRGARVRPARAGEAGWPQDLPAHGDSIALADGAVSLEDAAGKVLWRAPAKGSLGGVRPPDRVATRDHDEELVHVQALGPDWLVVTSKRIARLTADGRATWTLPAMRDTFVAAAAVAPVPGGDLLLWGWGRISDSGVEILRLRPDDGQVVFRVRAEPLGVGHSKYGHDAHVRLRGPKIDIVSIGSYGTFVEVRSLAKGTALVRWKPRVQEP